MKLTFEKISIPCSVKKENWIDWKWQLRHSLQSLNDFDSFFCLREDEKKAFQEKSFTVKTTPYYAELCKKYESIRKMTIPSSKELNLKGFDDPLGEKDHNPVPRIIHRYPDRVLFLVTDFCGIYCRYCTRKHFTAKNHHIANKDEYLQALSYIQSHKGIREVILSGGDPLTLSDKKIEKILFDLRSIDHVEIIRIGSRMPAVCPFRISTQLIHILKQAQPVFIMTHFNHPKELTLECKNHLLRLSDNGICAYNQMVLLNGINNHPAVVQALSRRLLYVRVRPYYMFQCDPSQGSDHFRTTIENSKWIQKQLWGTLSGLALPRLSMDLPGGGGKVELVPDHFIEKKGRKYFYKGFDGMKLSYENPTSSILPLKKEIEDYLGEWELLTQSSYKNSPIS